MKPSREQRKQQKQRAANWAETQSAKKYRIAAAVTARLTEPPWPATTTDLGFHKNEFHKNAFVLTANDGTPLPRSGKGISVRYAQSWDISPTTITYSFGKPKKP